MNKRFRFWVLGFVFLFSVFPSVRGFSDTQDEAVNFLRTQQVFDQALNFYPDSQVKRGEFVMWALKNQGVFFDENTRMLEPFKDIGGKQEFAPYVARAWQLGALKTADKFNPYRNITRFEALKILLILEGVPTPLAGFYLSAFEDMPADASVRSVIAKALEMRIVRSRDESYFGVNDYMTRLEVSNLLYDMLLTAHGDQMIYINDTRYLTKEKEDIFNEVWKMLHNRYLRTDQIDDIKLMEAAISGMVNSLDDPFTVFFPKQEAEDFMQYLDGQLEGIGAQVDIDLDSGYVLIIAPLKDAPAEKSGLKSGDLIIEVDGVDIHGMSLDEAISLIKGPSGSTVDLLIRRGGVDFIISVKREKIELKTVFGRLQDGYLIIDLDLFGRTTVSEFQKVIAEQYNPRVKGIVLDLRSNPGGFLDTAMNILGEFFAPETVGVVTVDANAVQPQKIHGSGLLKDVPLAILVNQYSASASEIIAGCVQDHKRGVVLGQTTYGKGTVQELIQFYDGSSFKFTISEWKTPNMRVIEKKGIEPDITISETDDDALVNRAILELKKR